MNYITHMIVISSSNIYQCDNSKY